VVEKGWAVVQISVKGVQGHASKPPRESAIGILAKAVANLVSSHLVMLSLKFDIWADMESSCLRSIFNSY
jgi:acetylornithine deacetylase/succinyl-diaminopimelate desuccinylase-like protein